MWWYPWGEEAFAAARQQGKPIFLSIGYSTCYWCHVMEKESFEQQDVADVLNEHFICIKLDREERPDVDGIYMQAVLALNGHGGWPMSVFLTPELKPFWGGTYFPRLQFLSILNQISTIWRASRDKISESANSLTAYLRERDFEPEHGPLTQAPLHLALSQLEQSFDSEHGGFGSAPKFPPSSQLGLLLRLHRRGADLRTRGLITKTLNAMARGGIYDQLGGGFHRYSTDERWLVPHFEKMLYDNALLAGIYIDAYRLLGEETWAGVAQETLEYMLKDLLSPEGGFYTAEDAGEVGKEGEFYVWELAEIERLLDPRACAAFREAHMVTEQGNFENGSTILTFPAESWAARRSEVLAQARAEVLKARQTRCRPHRDEKILLGWNALAVSALSSAFQAFQDVRYLQAAQRCMKFLKAKLWNGETLLRRYCAAEVSYDACQEDFAFLIAALLDLYESDFDDGWLGWARFLQQKQDSLFWDSANGGYFYSNAQELPARQKEYIDGATPSGNSVALMNLRRLSVFFHDEPAYRERADALQACFLPIAARQPSAICRALWAFDFAFDAPKEIAIISAQASDSLTVQVQQGFFPSKVLCRALLDHAAPSMVPLLRDRGMIDSKTTAYVCERGSCQLPTVEWSVLKNQLSAFVALYE